jgi:hypothetical protein
MRFTGSAVDRDLRYSRVGPIIGPFVLAPSRRSRLSGTRKIFTGVAAATVLVAAATLFSSPAPAGPTVTVYKTPT